MDIDFTALGLVAVVTVVAAVTLVTVVSLGARLLEMGDPATVSMPRRIGGWAMFVIAAALILFGLYLVIPAFHS